MTGERFAPSRGASEIYTTVHRDRIAALSTATVEGDAPDFGELRVRLEKTYRATQHTNGEWADSHRFKDLREALNDSSLDGIIINDEGRVVGRPWSTFNTYASGKKEGLPPTMDVMISLMLQREEMVYPLAPYRDTTFFWFRDNTEMIQELFENERMPGVTTEEYLPTNTQAIPRLPLLDVIHMARVPRGKVGVGKAASQGVVLGVVRFWENNDDFVPERYIPNVFFERSKILERQTFVSPLGQGRVIAAGALPMDEKHVGLDVIRVDSDLAKLDFVAQALIDASEHFQKPVALRFTSYRPWFGEMPRHGV